MRSFIDTSIRSAKLLGALVFLATACDASGGAGSGAIGARNRGPAGSGGTGSLSGGIDLPLGTTGGSDHFAGGISSDSGSEIAVSGEVKDVQLTLNASDGTAVVDPVWSVDDTKIGSISGDGVFHANGFVGGVVTISASVGTSSVSVLLTVNVDITSNLGQLSEADQALLVAGAATPVDAAYKFLYPYNGTVFPRGLAAPLLQLAGAAASSTYTTLTAPHFSYKHFSGAASPIQITIPAPVWKGVTLTAGQSDDVTVAVSKNSDGQVSGPVAQSWRIAQASMKGIIYYNTYSSPLTDDPNDVTKKGGILRIKAGGAAEVVMRGCTVCHSVSANGSVLATGSGYVLADFAPDVSATYNLSTAGEVTPRATSDDGLMFPFAGLTPDGEKALSNGLPPGAWPTKIMRGVYSAAGYRSQLLDTATGAPLAATGLNVNYLQTPSFSPDAKRVVFLNGDMLDNRVLSVMDFDNASNAFSGLMHLVTNPNEAMAWPSFLPDGSAVVYHAGSSFDSYEFTGGETQSKPQFAEVRMVEIADKSVKKLNALNGRDAKGTLLLPYGEAAEGRMNYEPNVLPVAVGGYYWALFTSRRTYGNTIAPGSALSDPQDPWGSDARPSLRKKVWLAAIDVDHVGVADPSHPAFFLPGQELAGGNMRAFGALAPCQPDGGACESGSDCCGGYCRQTSQGATGVPVLECVPPPMDACSQTDEPCVVSEDCCNAAELCVNARCTLRSPPK